jgi:hypothetical protein
MKKAILTLAVLCGIGFGASAQSITPIKITNIVPNENSKSSYATVYTCVNDTHTVGYLLIPHKDESSMEIFNRSVSEDHWEKAVGISPKRYTPDLIDVQQAEVLLAELMIDGIIPKMGRWNRYIGNPTNYTKYFRTYGFYLNADGERCVYIVMDLDPPFPGHAGFSRMWDGCDAVVYINLNLEKREVIRAYPSTCQDY